VRTIERERQAVSINRDTSATEVPIVLEENGHRRAEIWLKW
jgi:hypothetical protein